LEIVKLADYFQEYRVSPNHEERYAIMNITLATEAPLFSLPGIHFTGHTAPSRGASELCTWRLQVDPGIIGDPHRLDREEVFVILEGSLTVTVNDEEATLQEGDSLAVPAGALLRVGNRGTAPAQAIVCLPAGARATMEDGREFGIPPWAR